MGIVNGSLELGYKNTAWFTANPTLVLKEGQIVYLEQTGNYKIGNGSTQLSALSFLGISSETQTLQNVTDLGNFTTNNIETAGITTDYVQLDTTATTTGAVGKLTWNDVDGTANLGLKGGNVTLQIGQEFLARVVNKTATNISLLESNYQAVRITGAIGQRPKVDLALADNDLNSATTLGLVTETIANNAEGFITTSGQVKEINTTGSLQGETWVDGDTLYLSGTVAGRITNIKPIAPIHTVIIGFVEYAHAIHGKIFVKVNNGYELEELHNVSAIAPNNNEVLTYETSTTLWKPKTVVSALGFTPYNATNPDGYISGINSSMVTTALGFTPYNSTNPSGYITGITSGMVTTALGFTPYNATNPDGYITSSALTPYAPISNPTFTTAITTPILYGSSLSGGNLVISSTSNATKGTITIGNANSDTVFLGNQQFGFTSVVFYTASSATGFSLSRVTATDTTPTFVINRSDGTTGIGGVLNKISLIANGLTRFSVNGVTTSGATTSFSLTKPDNTNQTLSTSIAGWNYNGGTRQWATGAITTQSENVWGATTYSFVGASTITNAYGNVFNAPIAGTNATITNNYAALFNGQIELNNSIRFTGVPTSSSDVNGFYGNNTSTTFFASAGPNPQCSASNGGFILMRGNTYTASGGQRGWSVFSSGLVSSPVGPEGCVSFFTGASVEKLRIYPNGNIVIQNAGTYTDNGYRLDVNGTGRFQNNLTIGSTGQLIEIKQTANAPTYTQTGATSSIFRMNSGTRSIFFESYAADLNYINSTGAKLGIAASAAGISFFIASSEKINIASSFFLLDGFNIQTGTTTGSKIGTATTQKISFWNATPIVQPANTVSLNGVLENTGLMASGSIISTINKPLVVGANTTPRTGVATDGVTSVLGDLKTWAANYHSGEVLYNEVSGEALNFGQLCYRNAAGKWQKATGSSSTIAAYNMLGICLQTVGVTDTAISILTRGYVESTYLSAGAVGNPLFMDATTAGSITNTAPSTAGNVVRIIGNVFWSSALQTNSKWIVYFNPDNTWIEL